MHNIYPYGFITML